MQEFKVAKRFSEKQKKAYVDIDDDLTFLVDDSFIWTSEADGYNHLYFSFLTWEHRYIPCRNSGVYDEIFRLSN